MILVTGGAGYIGSIVAGALREAGRPYVVFDSLEKGTADAVQDVPLVVGDIRSREDLRRAFREHPIDCVMHFAAYVSVTESLQDPARYYENNTIGTYHLLEAMREANVKRLVFSSTAAVYGLPQRLPIDEEHPLQPTNPYGESKLAAERLIHGYASMHGLSATILRYFNAAGADPIRGLGPNRSLKEDLISLAMRVALGESQVLEVYGSDYSTRDGTCIRDFVHVQDLARAHLLASGSHHQGVRTYNLGSGKGFTVREVIAAVARVSGRPLPTAVAPAREGDPPEVLASSGRIHRELGWIPRQTALDVMVGDTWAFHTANAASVPPGE